MAVSGSKVMLLKMEKTCPVANIISILSKKWNLLILRQLNENGKKRFNELLKEMSGVSSRTLSKRLAELKKANLITKTRFKEIPPKVEYSLTESGRELIKCFRFLDKWAEKWGN